ncbi:pyridoxamine 5'-phosphate oxidase family protein [Enterococcus sp. LJL128]|uniref:pyridoxamine 5'-phosphate oxidase family protein n=1 Tax=Enterococcus sp. LJL51 TaxID=3416656 RepID=UPI003CE8FC19
MKVREKYEEMMETQMEIALATSVYGQPNVRIVNFLYDSERKVVYFSTFKESDKVKEIEKNPKVAFTTVVTGEENNHIRVLEGHAEKSEYSLLDLAEQWVAKMPFYQEIIDMGTAQLDVYEISFEKATVIQGMMAREDIAV